MVSTPKINFSKFGEFLKSKELIAVGSAVLLTPLVLGLATSIVSRFPLLRDNFAIGMAVVAFIIFVIAGMVGNGLMKAILIGLAGGVLLAGLQTTSAVQGLLAQLAGVAK